MILIKISPFLVHSKLKNVKLSVFAKNSLNKKKVCFRPHWVSYYGWYYFHTIRNKALINIISQNKLGPPGWKATMLFPSHSGDLEISFNLSNE